MTLIYLFIIAIAYVLYNFYNKHFDFYSQILNNAKIPDYTRWILSDKYVSKKYAELFGFKVSKTYQLVKYPKELKFNLDNCVIKPTDLCDSAGVYIIKDGINLNTKQKINPSKIINELVTLRSSIFNEYYMYDKMYDGLVPYTGYIVEELLLDDNRDVPSDYKCYVFGGKLYCIAVTFNRKKNDDVQTFNSVWFDRQWKPYKWRMIKEGYLYKNLDKPKCFDKLLELVENMGKVLKRHCRIDVYIINDEVYFGEFTFFTGAILHTFYCNMLLGLAWLSNPDDYSYEDKKLKKLVPEFYNTPLLNN